MESITLFSPATVANISCGFDVLGLCLDGIGDYMTIRKSDNNGVVISAIKGQDLPLDPQKNVAGVAALSLLKEYPTDFGIEIEIDKRIKPGSGIGSSAASAAGAVFGVNELMGRPCSKRELIKYAMAGEKLASGSAHADNVAPALLGGITLVRSISSMEVINLPASEEIHLVVLHPQMEIKTIEAREVIKKEVSLDTAIQQAANLGTFVCALYTKDFKLLSRSMVDLLAEPYRSKLIPKFDMVKKAALDFGALGCGISGSGPSIYALVEGNEKLKNISTQMERAFQTTAIPYELHLSKINNDGIKVIR